MSFTRVRSLLILVVSLVLLQGAWGINLHLPGSGGRYQLADDGKTRVWNPAPRPDELPAWEGERDDKGYATGSGTLTWYRVQRSMVTGSNLPSAPNKRTVVSHLRGKMENGKFVGMVEMTNARGEVYHATFVDGTTTKDGWEDGAIPAGKKKKRAMASASPSPNEAEAAPAPSVRPEKKTAAVQPTPPELSPPVTTPAPTPTPEHSVAMMQPPSTPTESTESTPTPVESHEEPPAPTVAPTVAPTPVETSKVDEDKVRQVGNDFRDSWMKHDSKALGRTVSDNVEFVAMDGTKVRGKGDLAKYTAKPAADQITNSSGTPSEPEVRAKSADEAEVSWKWTVRAQLNPDGSLKPRQSGVTTLNMQKRDGKWVVTSGQNTKATSATDLAEPQPPKP